MPSRFSIETVFKAVDRMTKPVKNMGKGLKRFSNSAKRTFKQLGRAVKSADAKITSLAKKIGTVLIAGIAAVGGAAAVGIKQMAEFGDEAAKTARRLGVTTEALQELRFAAERQGVSSGILNSSFTALQKRVGELKSETGSLYGFLNKTGQTALIRQLKGAKNTEEAFNILTVAMNKLEDPMDKAALASAAFSRAGVDMLKLFEAGIPGIKALREEARALGGVMSNETAAAAEAFQDSVSNLQLAIKGLGFTLLGGFLPIITKLQERFARLIASNRDFINQKLQDFIKKIIDVFKQLRPAFDNLIEAGKNLTSVFQSFTKTEKLAEKSTSGFIVIVGTLTEIIKDVTGFIKFLDMLLGNNLIKTILGIIIAIKALSVIMSIFNVIMGMNPIVLIIMAAAVALVLLLQNWEKVSNAIITALEWWMNLFKKLGNIIAEVFNEKIVEPFMKAIDLFAEKIKELIKVANRAKQILFEKSDQPIRREMNKLGMERLQEIKRQGQILQQQEQDAERLPEVISPEERTARSIEEKTEVNKAELTIKNESGRAATLEGQTGKNIRLDLQESGAF